MAAFPSDSTKLLSAKRPFFAGGELMVSGVALREGDGLKLQQERGSTLSQDKGAEVLVFDLP